MSALALTTEQATCELQVTARGGQGARAMASLLAAIGRAQGFMARSIRCDTDPLRIRHPDAAETALVAFEGSRLPPTAVKAVLDPTLHEPEEEGLVLVNSPVPLAGAGTRCIDATAIATALGVPAYLPMVGAVARTAGWDDLATIKATVRMALKPLAPYWAETAAIAVGAGYYSLV